MLVRPRRSQRRPGPSGYGAGDGYAQDVHVCPGATRAFERHGTEYWLHRVTGSTDRVVWHGHVRDVVIQGGHAYVIDGLELFEVNMRDGGLEPLVPLPVHVQGITISPDGNRLAGFVFGPLYGATPTPSRVISVRIADGMTSGFELTDHASGQVAWLHARTIAYLPGGSDDHHAWFLDARTMRSVGGFDGWYAAESVVLGGAVFGIGWGQLARADLDDGDVRLVRAVDGPETFVLDVVPSAGSSA
jgi:hypothetical protein